MPRHVDTLSALKLLQGRKEHTIIVCIWWISQSTLIQSLQGVCKYIYIEREKKEMLYFSFDELTLDELFLSCLFIQAAIVCRREHTLGMIYQKPSSGDLMIVSCDNKWQRWRLKDRE